jgi:hypothetical protein
MLKKIFTLSWIGFFCIIPAGYCAVQDDSLAEIQRKMDVLQAKIDRLKQGKQQASGTKSTLPSQPQNSKKNVGLNQSLYVYTPDQEETDQGFYPTAIMAGNKVITYIAGTPVISSPYMGQRPSFDGSDYIVNISSINRDVRLMEQRRRLEEEYTAIGYSAPSRPIISVSGKLEPFVYLQWPYVNDPTVSGNVGGVELDFATILNKSVEAYIGIANMPNVPETTNQGVANTHIGLSAGFLNIGNLDQSPIYLTVGQLYVPFGRFSSSMLAPTLTQVIARTKANTIILGYQEQYKEGMFAAVYAFDGDTTLNRSGVGGVNLGYRMFGDGVIFELGGSYITSIDNSNGMQNNGASGTNFAGFGSLTHGNEYVEQVGAFDLHSTLSFDRYNVTVEWVATLGEFPVSDLSFNGEGASPQALQVESGVTFMVMKKPASLSYAYQWSADTVALRLPKQRFSSVFNISIWKDTIESIEYRHDIDFNTTDYGNGLAPNGGSNTPIYGTGKAADTIIVQLGVYF